MPLYTDQEKNVHEDGNMPHFTDQEKNVHEAGTSSGDIPNKDVSETEPSSENIPDKDESESSYKENIKSEISRKSSECKSIEELAEAVRIANPDKSLTELSLILNQQRQLIDKLLEERWKISQLDAEIKMPGTRTKPTSPTKTYSIWSIFSRSGNNKGHDGTSQSDQTILNAKIEMKDIRIQTEFLCNADEVLRDVRDIQHLQDEYIRLGEENEKLRAQLNQRTHECIGGIKDLTNSEERACHEEEGNGERKSVKQNPTPIVKPIMKNLDMQVYSNMSAGEMGSSMEEAMKREITTRMLAHHVQVNFEVTIGKRKLHEPSVIICPIFSRIGTDVDATFCGFENVGKGTLLLVVHNKEEHNLPKVKSENLLSRYSRLGGILDMAYRKDKNFYSTSLNEVSFDVLVNFLLKYVENK